MRKLRRPRLLINDVDEDNGEAELHRAFDTERVALAERFGMSDKFSMTKPVTMERRANSRNASRLVFGESTREVWWIARAQGYFVDAEGTVFRDHRGRISMIDPSSLSSSALQNLVEVMRTTQTTPKRSRKYVPKYDHPVSQSDATRALARAATRRSLITPDT